MKKPPQMKPREHAAIQVLDLLGAIKWDSAPLGLIMRAEMFAKAGRLVPTPAEGHDFAKWHLASHSLELALKGFLALQGYPLVDLFDHFGHKLNKILDEGIAVGLLAAAPLSKSQLSALRELHEPHAARVFEYPSLVHVSTGGMKDLAAIDTYLDIADYLIAQLYDPCLHF